MGLQTQVPSHNCIPVKCSLSPPPQLHGMFINVSWRMETGSYILFSFMAVGRDRCGVLWATKVDVTVGSPFTASDLSHQSQLPSADTRPSVWYFWDAPLPHCQACTVSCNPQLPVDMYVGSTSTLSTRSICGIPTAPH